MRPHLPESHAFFIRKEFIRKLGINGQNLEKILRKSRGSISRIGCFVGQYSIFRHYCTRNVEDGIQTRVYKINSEGVIHFNQFTPAQLEKILRKS